MGTTWLITREEGDAGTGRDSLIVPCVETKILPWPFLPLAATRGEGLTFFTSRRAVSSWKTSRAPLGDVAALSPATTEALKHEGITPTITSEEGVVALAAAVLRASHATKVYYPTSNAGLASPDQAEALRMLAARCEVDRRVAYEVTAPAGLRHALEASAIGDWSISFASPSAVHHFFASGAVLSRAPRHVSCLGASTERAWNTARPEGWPPAVSSTEFPFNPRVAS